MQFMLITDATLCFEFFSFQKSRILICTAGLRVPPWPAPNSRNTESRASLVDSISLLSQLFRLLSQHGGIEPILCDSVGRGLLEACAWFLVDTVPPVPFPFVDFALYPFTVISHSCEYDCMLSPVHFLNRSLKGGGRLRDLLHSATFLKY